MKDKAGAGLELWEKEGAVSFRVKVSPRASQSRVTGVVEGALKVRVAAPPVDGAANEELIRTLARFFGTARANVELVAGAGSKTKTARVYGLSAREAALLAAAI